MQRRPDSWEMPQFSSSTCSGSGSEVGVLPVFGHFSASVLSDVETQGGGDAGSLTPRCPATNSMHASWCVENTHSLSSCLNHNHHNTHHPQPPQPPPPHTHPPTHPPTSHHPPPPPEQRSTRLTPTPVCGSLFFVCVSSGCHERPPTCR